MIPEFLPTISAKWNFSDLFLISSFHRSTDVWMKNLRRKYLIKISDKKYLTKKVFRITVTVQIYQKIEHFLGFTVFFQNRIYFWAQRGEEPNTHGPRRRSIAPNAAVKQHFILVSGGWSIRKLVIWVFWTFFFLNAWIR